MKYLLSALVLVSSVSAFASEKMGAEAHDIFRLMTNAQVKECMKDFPSDFVNLEIEKQVYRCPGCVTYTISANELNFDVASAKKSVVILNGRMVRGFGGQWVQTYGCGNGEQR